MFLISPPLMARVYGTGAKSLEERVKAFKQHKEKEVKKDKSKEIER